MRHMWSITFADFRVPVATAEKHGDVIITDMDNNELYELIMDLHIESGRRHKPHPIVRDYSMYRREDYTDEMAIYHQPRGGRWRKLINLQYEGTQ